MKPIIEIIIGVVVLGAIVAGLWYVYIFTEKINIERSHRLNNGAKAVAICCSWDGQVVYVLEPGKLFKSTDAGRTWKLVDIK